MNVGVPSGFFLVWFIILVEGEELSYLLHIGIIYLVISIIWLFISKYILLGLMKREKITLPEEVTITLRDDAYEIQSSEIRVENKYTYLKRIEGGDAGIYLYNKGGSTNIIPKKAFKNQEEESEFLNIMKDKNVLIVQQ